MKKLLIVLALASVSAGAYALSVQPVDTQAALRVQAVKTQATLRVEPANTTEFNQAKIQTVNPQ